MGKKLFGEKGPYVDEYVNSGAWKTEAITIGTDLDIWKVYVESPLCMFQGSLERWTQFLGFCRLSASLQLEEEQSDAITSWDEFVSNRVASKGRDHRSWLTFHHIYHPIGHTVSSYTYGDTEYLDRYKKYYDEQQKKLSKQILPRTIDLIQKNDPGSVVIIYGDHGTFVSRRMKPEKNLSFHVRDRHAIFISVFQMTNACEKKEDLLFYSNNGYTTPEKVIAGVVRCLAQDPKTVDETVNFLEKYEFRNYTYE